MAPKASRFGRDLLVLFVLFLLPLVVFWPVTLGGRTLLPADNLVTMEPWRSAAAEQGWPATPHNGLLSDLVLENYVWRRFLLESAEIGQLPLWNPSLFAGQPFLAAGQHSALYPFSVVFYVLPLWQAYGWFIVLQLFLAGAFMYAFARVLGLARAPALIAAVTYELCSFLLAGAVFPMIVAGAAWLPLVLASLELLIRGARVPWLALGAVALGCQVLAGHVEITYYTLLIAAAWAAWRLLGMGARLPAPPPAGGRWARAIWALRGEIAGCLLLAILGVGLAAAQFVPLLEYAQANFREGSASYDQIVGWAYPTRHVLAFLMPNVFGSPAQHEVVDWWTGQAAPALNARGESISSVFWGTKNYVEGAAYAGILPLFLAALGAVAYPRFANAARRATAGLPSRSYEGRPYGLGAIDRLRAWAAHPHVPFFTALAALALTFAFGLPTYRLIFWLPGVSQLHSPFRWVWPFALCVAVLAGFGAQYLASLPLPPLPSPDAGKKPGTWKMLFPGIRRGERGLGVWGEALAGLAFWGGWVIVAAVVAAGALWERTGPVVDAVFRRLALADGAFADARMFFSFEARQVLLLGLFLVMSGVVLRVSRCPIYLPARLGGRPVWEPLAVLVVALDLALAVYGFNPAADPSILTYRPPVADFLAEDTSLWRFTTYVRQDLDPATTNTFDMNTGMYFGWQDVRGYDSMITRQYVDYMQRIQPQGGLEFNRIGPLTKRSALDSPLLDLLNVKYVLTEIAIDNPAYKLVYDAEVKVYENTRVLPRAFTVHICNVRFGAGAGPNPHESVTIDADPGKPLPPCVPSVDPNPLHPATITKYTPLEVMIDVTEGGRYLVLADSYFPGWLAYARPLGGTEQQERELTILRAEGNFRAVELPPGEWTVRFRYSPLSFRMGVFLSFLSAVLLVFGVGVWAWRRVYAREEGGSAVSRVARNSLAPVLVNLLNRGVDLAFATVMLRILGPANAGEYYFAGVIAGWFEIVTNFGLNTYLTREVSRAREEGGRFLVNTTLLRWMLWAVVSPALFLVIALWSTQFALRPETALAIVLLYLALVPSGVSAGLTALFYAFERAEYPAAVTTISTVIKVSLGLLALLYGFGYVGLAAVAVVVNVATTAILLAIVLRVLPRLHWSARGWRDAPLQRGVLRESFPLMLNHLLATLFFKVDVTLLEPLRGAIVVGWYSTGYKFLEAYNIIPAFFTMALFPLMSRQAKESPEALARAYRLGVKFLVMIALPLAVVTVAWAYPLIAVLGGSAYLPHGAIALQIMVLSIPIGWINSLTQYVLIALGKQRSLTNAFLIAVAFNVAANLIFIPRTPNGYEAAAVITIFSEIVEGIPFYLYLRRALAPVPWARLLGGLFLAAGGMAAVTALLAPVSLLLAPLVGAAVYAALLLALRAIGPEERAVLGQVLRRGGPPPSS